MTILRRIRRRHSTIAGLVLGLTLGLLTMPTVGMAQEATKPEVGAFSFKHELTLPGTPEIIYDAITGDISGWWDHTFSENPSALYIEATPGGRFFELFENEWDGVLHGTVIFAQTGKRLTIDGPLGFNGYAINIISTFNLEPVTTDGADSTKVTVSVSASGVMEEGWDTAVEGVWQHFLFNGLKPYVEAGKHLHNIKK